MSEGTIDVVIQASLLLLLLTAAAFDVATLRIPNWIPASIAALFLASAAWNLEVPGLAAHLGASLIALVGGYVLFSLGYMGGGDVKLLAATALWVGTDLLLTHLALTSLLGLALLALLLPARLMARSLLPDGASRTGLPRSFVRGNGLPYGVAIAGSAAVLSWIEPAAHLQL